MRSGSAGAHHVAEVQGIVYVYLGDDPGDAAPPRVAELDEPGWIYEQDYMRDLPCAACSHPQAHDLLLLLHQLLLRLRRRLLLHRLKV